MKGESKKAKVLNAGQKSRFLTGALFRPPPSCF
jgi:hypothetical protein